MGEYNLNGFLPSELIADDLSNAFAMRADLHSAFDKRMFVFVPKPISSGRFVTHVLQQTSEIGPFYHNAALHPIRGVQVEFLLVRFAWAIFPLLTNFLTTRTERLLLLVKDRNSVAEEVSGNDCWRFAGNDQGVSKCRSNSPRMRRIEEIPCESIEETDTESDDTG
jgi:hypothetical protein